MRFLVAAFALTAAVPAVAAPPAWTVVPAQSSITFSGTHAGAPFTGKFGQWSAQIVFDPADLPHSSARVAIATATGKTGDGLRDTSLGQEEWFNPGKFPQASFVSSKISAAGPGRYVADGVLTIKGKAVPVKLPFTLAIAGNKATMRGTTSIDRLAFGMGAASDPSGAWVSKQIGLTIAVVATKK
jgi:cytochrome b561